MERANVFTVPPGVPFLDALVAALLEGRLIEGFDVSAPFALADVTLYLPTRRAARAIRESFLARLRRPLLLPRIRTLGDIDEDEAGLDIEAAEIPPAVPALERQLVLTQFVLAWSGAAARSVAGFPEEELIVPASPADAARLAASLAALIDQVGVEPDAWRGLFSGTPADLARYWAITLEFLKIATEFWPAHLQERALIDPGARRDMMIRAEAARLARYGSESPVIAAGSTGSVPATAELLRAIAGLRNGAVVLPGLDQGLDDEAWRAVGVTDREPAGAGHPQFGLKMLLESLGLLRDAVLPLAAASDSLQSRDRFVSEAMRPASTTERWATDGALSLETKREAVAKVGIVEAANEREEALAVAVLLREATETPDAVAALITPDRGLARRVAIELRRWGIDVDDSAGRPLGRTPPGKFARLVASAALGGAEAETLLALLKHPLAAFGRDPEDTHRAAGSLERAALRGPRLKPGLAAVRHTLSLRHAAKFGADDEGEGVDKTFAAKFLTPREWEAADKLAARVEEALSPLEALADADGPIDLAALVEAHLAALRSAASDEKGRASLFSDEAGETLAFAFEELQASAGEGPEILPNEYPELFGALIERVAVRRRGGVDPRVHIWGALEARLQSVDKVVLGGLNEGTWPQQTRLDPLLSRPMRAALALEPPERRIGLAAHDFAQALGAPEVWLTRADREDGEPKVASRWLQRLVAHAGDELVEEMRKRGGAVLALARQLDRPSQLDPSRRPSPSPPVDLRPKRLSATRIETLIRDPYAIYAQYVLDLRPFEPLAKLPDARERGNIVHDILERFIGERPRGPFDEAALTRLVEIGREVFDRHADFPEIAALWWPRFEKIALWFAATEAGRPDIEERHVEATGTMAIGPDFTLSARADRIDRLADGTLSVIDYKTGTPPSIDEVLSLSPQLPLEALLAAKGGFEGIEAAPPSRLEYFQLSGRGEGGVVWDRSGREARRGKDAVSLPQALVATEERLEALIKAFAAPDARYLSRKIPKRGRVFVGDYDHLARVAEWTTTEEEDDQGIPQP